MTKDIRNIGSVLKTTVFMAKCLCLFPLRNENKVHWLSWKVLHGHLLALFSALQIVAYMCYAGRKGHNANHFEIVIINLCVCSSAPSFIHLGRKWPLLMEQWRRLAPSNSYNAMSQLRRQINIIIGLYLVMMLGQYLLSVFDSIRVFKNVGTLENFIKMIFFYDFEFLPYNPMLLLVIIIHNFFVNLIWSFVDLFIIIVSFAMAFHFKQFNSRLSKNQCETFEVKVTDINPVYPQKRGSVWKRLREDYDKLSQLCCLVDNALSNITIISYSLNLLYILIGLYRTLRTMEHFTQKLYFFYSFGTVVIRVATVTLYASSINEESKEPIDFLISLPSELYNKEINRWLTFLLSDTIALTGKHFFKIKRGFILSVTVAVVTYELILIQFNPRIE